MSGGFTAGALVAPTDQATVLLAIQSKIRAEIAGFGTETTCFISDTPEPGIEVQDELFCTIAPGSAEYDPEHPIGEGSAGIVEYAVFQVTVWSKIMLDRTEHEVSNFLDPNRGLLPLKKLFLKCLAGQQMFSDYPSNTEPLLIEWLRPTQAVHPETGQKEGKLSSFALVFVGQFRWDLS